MQDSSWNSQSKVYFSQNLPLLTFPDQDLLATLMCWKQWNTQVLSENLFFKNHKFLRRNQNNFCDQQEYEKRWYYPLYYLGFRPDKAVRALEIYNMKQYQAVPIMLRTPFCLKTSLPLLKHGTLESIGDWSFKCNIKYRLCLGEGAEASKIECLIKIPNYLHLVTFLHIIRA